MFCNGPVLYYQQKKEIILKKRLLKMESLRIFELTVFVIKNENISVVFLYLMRNNDLF